MAFHSICHFANLLRYSRCARSTPLPSLGCRRPFTVRRTRQEARVTPACAFPWAKVVNTYSTRTFLSRRRPATIRRPQSGLFHATSWHLIDLNHLRRTTQLSQRTTHRFPGNHPPISRNHLANQRVRSLAQYAALRALLRPPACRVRRPCPACAPPAVRARCARTHLQWVRFTARGRPTRLRRRGAGALPRHAAPQVRVLACGCGLLTVSSWCSAAKLPGCINPARAR